MMRHEDVCIFANLVGLHLLSAFALYHYESVCLFIRSSATNLTPEHTTPLLSSWPTGWCYLVSIGCKTDIWGLSNYFSFAGFVSKFNCWTIMWAVFIIECTDWIWDSQVPQATWGDNTSPLLPPSAMPHSTFFWRCLFLWWSKWGMPA